MLFQGTQSSNPHNDYCQHFVDTGQRPQNFIRDVGLADRFEEYPKLRELIKLKDELIATTATPPMYLKCDLKVWRQYLCRMPFLTNTSVRWGALHSNTYVHIMTSDG